MNQAMFSLPFANQLSEAKRVLLAGAGGGYDLIGAVPLFHELQAAGKSVHLASLTFSDPASTPNAVLHPDHPVLASVQASSATPDVYCPEAWLAKWLAEQRGYQEPIWLLKKAGVVQLQAAYEHLVHALEIDAIVLIDGGIDAALRGDETSIGTPIEDLASLCAVSKIQGVQTFLACLGMTAELRDGISHAQFLSRVAELTRLNAFLGCQSLTQLDPGGQAYADAVTFIFANQEGRRRSHIQEVVVAAMQGEFGMRGEDSWLSPLLPMFWYFDLKTVASSHLFLSELAKTESAWEVSLLIEGLRKNLTLQPKQSMPI